MRQPAPDNDPVRTCHVLDSGMKTTELKPTFGDFCKVVNAYVLRATRRGHDDELVTAYRTHLTGALPEPFREEAVARADLLVPVFLSESVEDYLQCVQATASDMWAQRA